MSLWAGQRGSLAGRARASAAVQIRLPSAGPIRTASGCERRRLLGARLRRSRRTLRYESFTATTLCTASHKGSRLLPRIGRRLKIAFERLRRADSLAAQRRPSNGDLYDASHHTQSQRQGGQRDHRPTHAARAVAARPTAAHRHARRLRHRAMRRLHRAPERPRGEVLLDARAAGAGRRGHDHRGPGQGRRAASDAGGVPRVPRPAMRLLHAGHGDVGGEAARRQARTPASRRSAKAWKATSAAAPAITTSSSRSSFARAAKSAPPPDRTRRPR